MNATFLKITFLSFGTEFGPKAFGPYNGIGSFSFCIIFIYYGFDCKSED
jgi:hypothetical protein